MFCDKMPSEKPENPADILAWKNSLKLMANEAINKFLSGSMEKGLINNKKELTVTFVRGKMFGKYIRRHTFIAGWLWERRIRQYPYLNE